MKCTPWTLAGMGIVGKAIVYFCPNLLFGCTPEGWVTLKELAQLEAAGLVVQPSLPVQDKWEHLGQLIKLWFSELAYQGGVVVDDVQDWVYHPILHSI